MKRAGWIVLGVVVLVIVALAAVPALIDWSRYKDDIATRIEAATGRKVTIGGDVGLRLLPSPAFTAEQVAVANIPGAGDQPFATVDQLALRLRLLPLLTGRVAVESLRLNRPEINLVRLPDGRVNWEFTPEAKPGSSTEPAPDQPGDGNDGAFVGHVKVTDGRIAYHDGRSAPLVAEDVDAAIDAGGPSGPFRAVGGLSLRGTRAAFDGSIDQIGSQRGSPARLRIDIPQADARAEIAGLLSQLSGGPTLRGRVTVTAPDPARLSALGGGPATLPLPTGAGLQAEAELVADRTEIALTNLVVTLGEARGSGAVTVGLSAPVKIDAQFTVASLDLDKWRPEPPKPAPQAQPAPQQPATPPSPSQVAEFTLPRDVFAVVEVGVDTLSWRGDVVRQARVRATLEAGDLVINGATAQLPGNSVVSVAGVLSPVKGRPGFDGQAEARSDNLRGLLGWLGVDAGAIPRDRLRRLEASAELRGSGDMVEARALTVVLDGARAKGGLNARLTERPSFGVRLAVDHLNLDAYLPAEAAAAPAKSEAATAADRQEPETAPRQDAPLRALGEFDADMALTIDRLTLNATAAERARLEARLHDGTLTVSQAAASIAGSTASASGTVLDLTRAAPRVENVAFRIDSPQPARLLRFLGMASPPDLAALTADGKLDGDWQAIKLQARAETGGLQVSADGTLASPLDKPAYRVTLRADHANFAQMVRLFAPSYRPAGTVGAFSLSADLDGTPQAVSLSGLDVKAGPARLTGDAKVALGGPRPAITGQLSGNTIDLDPFMPAERTGLLLPGTPRLPPALAPTVPGILPAANGSGGPWSRERLDLSVLQALDARIQVQAQSLSSQGWALMNPRTTLVVERGAAAIDNLTGTLLGGDMALTGRLAAAGSLEATLTIAGANLSEARLGAGGIQVSQGRLNAETRFASTGQSSYQLAENLTGTGRLTVVDGTIQGFDLPAVNRQMQNIENIGSVLGLLNAGLSKGQTRFSKLSGTFAAERGIITTRDLRLDAEGGGATGEAVVRLPPWTMNAAIAIQLAGAQAPPAVVRLEGPIDNPRKIIDINAIQQHLVARGLGRALKGKEAGKVIEGLLGGRDRAQPDQAQPPQQQQPDGARVLQDLLKGLGR